MDNSSNKSNTRRNLKKEYIPLLIAILVLIILVMILVIVLFYKDDKGLIVPELPDAETFAGVSMDMSSGKFDENALNEEELARVKIEYNVVKDYHKAGVVLSNPVVNYADEEFLVTSSVTSTDPFMSVIDSKFQIKWINRIDKQKYERIILISSFKIGDKYYAFLEGAKENKKDIIAVKFNKKGNEEKKLVLLSDTKANLKKILKTDKGFAICLDGSENIKILFVSTDLVFTDNIFNLSDQDYNFFHSQIPRISSATYSNNKLTLIIQYDSYNNNKMYLLDYNIENKKNSIRVFNELQKIGESSFYTNEIIEDKGKFYTVYENKIYVFSQEGKVDKTYDYSKLTLEKDKKNIASACKDDPMSKECTIEAAKYYYNGLLIQSIKKYDSTLIVSSITNFNNVVDIFDENLKLKRRYLIKNDEYEQLSEAWRMDRFYLNDKLLEFSFYGVDTPSILITAMG